MVITILGMVADMELKFNKDRQSAGIQAAKGEGVYKGRTKNVDDEEIRRRIANGASEASVGSAASCASLTASQSRSPWSPVPKTAGKAWRRRAGEKACASAAATLWMASAYTYCH